MAEVRVYLPTYRRASMLERAIASLRAQRFTDWVAEVHNDDPGDPAPGRVVASLGDPRIQLVPHATNLGGTRTFNLFFKASAEPFYSVLEDDNWWEPDFLSTMLEHARRHPEVTVLWSNMRIWEELPEGDFRDTGRLVNQEPPSEAAELVRWGRRRQMMGALHSNSALLIRSAPGQDFRIPDVPIAAVELFRERLFPHPMLYVTQPLAHFTVTRGTARTQDRSEWAMLQTMLCASFLAPSNYPSQELAAIFESCRAHQPPATGALLLAALSTRSCRHLLAHTRPIDWFRLARGVARRPSVLLRTLRSRRAHADWWRFLDTHTAERFAQCPPSSS